MIVILGKIIAMFSIVLVGYGANRLGWLPSISSKYLSTLLINVASPCVVLVSMSQETLNADTSKVTLEVFLISLVLYAICTGVGFLAVRSLKVPLERQGVYVFCLTFTNNGFLGLPVTLAVFGDEGMFAMIISNIVMGLSVYTIGMLTITYGSEGKKDLKGALKAMVNIPMASCLIGLALFLIQIPIPAMLKDFMDLLGNMMVPLSMIVIGMQLSENGIWNTVKQKNLYLLSFLRLVGIPALTFLAMLPFGFPPMVVCIMTLTAALPPAALASILSELHGGNTSLAAGCVSLGTFFSLFTVPVTCALLVAYLG